MKSSNIKRQSAFLEDVLMISNILMNLISHLDYKYSMKFLTKVSVWIVFFDKY